MDQTAALVILILWLAALITLFMAGVLLIIAGLLAERPAGYLSTREVLVPAWCLLAGRSYRDRLRAVLREREAAGRLARTSLRDVARHRAEKQLCRDRVSECRNCGATRITFIPAYHPGMGPGFFGFIPPEIIVARAAEPRCRRCGHRYPDLPLSRFIDILGS